MRKSQKPRPLANKQQQTQKAREARIKNNKESPIRQCIRHEYRRGMALGLWKNRTEAVQELHKDYENLRTSLQPITDLPDPENRGKRPDVIYSPAWTLRKDRHILCTDPFLKYPRRLYGYLGELEKELAALGITYRKRS